MYRLDTRDRYVSTVSCWFYVVGQSDVLTSIFSEASDILVVHDLGVFNSWSDRRNICVFKRHFQSVEHSSVRSITNSVDTLNARRAGVSADEGKYTVDVPLATRPLGTWVSLLSG